MLSSPSLAFLIIQLTVIPFRPTIMFGTIWLIRRVFPLCISMLGPPQRLVGARIGF